MQAQAISNPDPTVDSGAVPPLHLKLLHSHGRSADGVLVLPAAGSGLARALALGGERLNTAQWEDAERCRVVWQGPAQGWWLSQGSRAVVCALNGKRVAAQAKLPLAAGDVLEVGWQRFEVQRAVRMPANSAIPAATPAVPTAAPVSPTPAAHTEVPEFDLRDLAIQADVSRTGGDPFDVLGIAGVEPAHTADALADPLAELFGEAPRGTASPRMQAHAAPAAPAGVLEALHHEFDRVVRDPTHLAGRADWDDLNAPGFERAPSLEELSRQAEPYPLMRDIVEPRAHIDRMISGFHPLARPTLLDPDQPEDVLRLFAPARLRGAPVAVPSLTRREHHDLSPDSHMRFDVFQPEAEKGPTP